MNVELISTTGVSVPLTEIVRYNPNDGLFMWLPRGRDLFKSDRSYSTFRTKMEGRQAFTTVSSHGYRISGIFGREYKAHRIAWALVHGEWPEEIDHIDGNRSNNKIANLRCVSHQINMTNTARRSDNKTGITGVSWDKRMNKWHVQIMSKGRPYKLGYFNDFSAAAEARAASELNLNFHPNHGRAS